MALLDYSAQCGVLEVRIKELYGATAAQPRESKGLPHASPKGTCVFSVCFVEQDSKTSPRGQGLPEFNAQIHGAKGGTRTPMGYPAIAQAIDSKGTIS